MLAVLVGGGPAFTDEIDFKKQVWPIFQTRCNDCHNGETREGQLRLDARSGFLAGGVSGRLVHPKDTNQSPLLQRILGHGDLDRMPLDEDPLTVREIDTIRQWLKEGAAWPEGVGARVDLRQTHWAYQKPRRPEIPQRDNLPKGNVGDPQNGFVHGRFSRDWVRNPIDHFVLERMRREGLAPSRPATRSKQLRRLYFDLVGIPPTADQMRTFLADDSPNAYDRVVDQLLASPRFGEKWARSWLDLARYADTNGFQADQFRSVWPYRDWVIDAMNQGMPFDQFTIEQLAGDLLPDATVSQKIATGFHRLTTCNVEAGVDPEENRVNQIIDRVNTTGTVWFGTTFECMQCHNHKYDPFTQREYYQMFAFFNNTPLEVRNRIDRPGFGGWLPPGNERNPPSAESNPPSFHWRPEPQLAIH